MIWSRAWTSWAATPGSTIDTPAREAVADAALRRPELADTPGPEVTRAELLGMLAMAAAG